MTKLMEHAIEKLRGLPEERQETFARFLLSELDTDVAWEQTTTMHSQKVGQLVEDVLVADSRGENESLDPDSL